MRFDRLTWLTPFLLATVTFVCFLPALSAGFVDVDDGLNIVGNPHIRGFSLENLRWMWLTTHGGHYQPLTWLTYALDYSLWGLNPFGFHLTNALLHCLTAVAVYALLRALLSRDDGAATSRRQVTIAAAIGALLFALHPLRCESVAWVTERRDVVSGLFWTLAVLAFVRTRAAEGAIRARWARWAFACFVLSLLAKAWGVTLPIVLLLLDRYLLRPHLPLRRLAAGVGPLLVPATLFAVLAAFAQHEAGAVKQLADHPMSARLAQVCYGLVFYPWKMLAPFDLAPFYYVADHSLAWTDPLYPICAAIVAGVTILAWFWRRRHPELWCAWLAYVVIVSPVLGVLQSGPQIVADRYSYLALLPFAALAAAAIRELLCAAATGRHAPWVGRAALTVACAALVGLSIRTWTQTCVWHDSVAFWRQVVKVTPRNATAQCGLAQALNNAREPVQAVEHYRRAIELNPGLVELNLNVGILSAQLERFGEAEAALTELLRVLPSHPQGLFLMGLVLEQQGRDAEALRYLQNAVDAGHRPAFFPLAMRLATAGQVDVARRVLQQLLVHEPDHAEARALLERLR